MTCSLPQSGLLSQKAGQRFSSLFSLCLFRCLPPLLVCSVDGRTGHAGQGRLGYPPCGARAEELGEEAAVVGEWSEQLVSL